MNWKIVVDSGCDVKQMDNLPEHIRFHHIPLKINFEDAEYTDDIHCDIEGMMKHMGAYKGRSSTACPSPEAWASAFADADCCIAIPTSSGVSGSMNSARLGMEMAMEAHPEKQIIVFDSLSIGPEVLLLCEEVVRLIESGASFESVCEGLKNYHKRTHLSFMLSSVENLVKNGRLSRLAGATVNVLGIRLVGIASEIGTLQLESKCRGFKKGAAEILKTLRQSNFKGGKVVIAHVFNEIEAKVIADSILKEFPKAALRLMKTGGICSFYAEMGGMLIGYEGDPA